MLTVLIFYSPSTCVMSPCPGGQTEVTHGHCPHIRLVPDFCSPQYIRGHHQTRRVTSHMILQHSSIGGHVRNY